MAIRVHKTELEGLLTIHPQVHGDSRGFFMETYRLNDLQAATGSDKPFVQGNHSRSTKNVLRGLHAEPWDKLIYIPHGSVCTAIADLRPDSRTFGKAEAFLLGDHDEQRRLLYIPNGCAHGFCVLSDSVDYTYLCTEYYTGQPKKAVAWNDPDLKIIWPIAEPLLSDADKKNPTLRQLFPEKFQ
ncbi:MAG TPA: dTDP-4-dehydrorhamnose 3,5-epimerase [Candidatus Binatia bacterium]|nr:dTDP-4-dehydrorhamnose 3,5-epimerase [Candidatus Binatia bacterium]